MTLDKHAKVSTELALELEGAALRAEKDTEEFLRHLLDTYAQKTRRNRETEDLRDFIREKNAEKWSDTKIAKAAGVSQQAVSRHRAAMGLPLHRRGRKKVC